MATSPSLTTHVWSNIPKNVYPDHTYEDHPTLMRLIAKNQKQDGGLNYQPNRIATKDNTSTWFAGTTLSAVISSASQTSALLSETYNWTNLVTPITITYDERLRASGDSEFTRIAMEDAKGEQAKLDHMNIMASKVSAGDGTSNTPRGLLYLVASTGAYGGVDPADDADWAGNAVSTATVLTGPSVLNDAYVLCLHKNRKPKWMPTTATLFAKCQNIFGMGIQTMNKDNGAYKFGVKSMDFMYGDIYLDRDITSGDFYMLEPDVIDLKQSTKFWMKKKAPVEPTDGTNIHLSTIGYIQSSFILGATERRPHGGYTALT